MFIICHLSSSKSTQDGSIYIMEISRACKSGLFLLESLLLNIYLHSPWLLLLLTSQGLYKGYLLPPSSFWRFSFKVVSASIVITGLKICAELTLAARSIPKKEVRVLCLSVPWRVNDFYCQIQKSAFYQGSPSPWALPGVIFPVLLSITSAVFIGKRWCRINWLLSGSISNCASLARFNLVFF